MPTISYPGFLGPAYKGASYIADAELCLNWYLEKNESPSAPNPYVMLSAPGFLTLITVSQAPIRGMFSQLGRAFFVAGYAFYELFYDSATGTWSATLRGSVSADANPVTISANGDAGNQLFITSGGIGYCYDLTSHVLTAGVGVAATTVTMGGFLEGRFLYLDGNAGAFYASALYDGLTWPADGVAQSTSGDPWVAMVVTPDDLIRLLGETTSEAWALQGDPPPMPFSKIAEASIPYGIQAPFAWAVDSAISWLAQNKKGSGLVVRAPGYTPERVSTHAIEDEIHSYGSSSDATMFKYQEAGHSFAVVTFPTAQKTWVFDQTESLWHQRDYWDTTTSASLAYRPGCQIEAFGFTIVGDRLTGTLYEMNSTYYSDVGGVTIRRVRQAPRFSVNQKRVTINNLQLVMDVGQGLSTGQGSDPQMMLSMSKDGGQTFGPERWTTAGAIGQWDTRVRWNILGQGRNFTPRFVATDPIPWPITDCLIDYTVGLS